MTNEAKTQKMVEIAFFLPQMTMALGYWVELITLLAQPQSCGRTFRWNPTRSQPYTEVKERGRQTKPQ